MKTEIEKYPAFEKWLMRESDGDKRKLSMILWEELLSRNEYMLDWYFDVKINQDLWKLSDIIIERNTKTTKTK